MHNLLSALALAAFVLLFAACRPEHFEAEHNDYRTAAICDDSHVRDGVSGRGLHGDSHAPGEALATWNGVPICGVRLKTLEVGGRAVVRGRVPHITGLDDTMPWFDDLETARLVAKADGGADVVQLLESRQCYFPIEGELRPAWELSVTINDEPQRIVANGDLVYDREFMRYNAVGEARIYKNNPSDEIISVVLNDLDGSGFLRSPRFATTVPLDIEKAFSPSLQFIYSPLDPRFREVSVFANAERMAAWLTQPEHEYSLGCIPILLEVHERQMTTEGNVLPLNNAAYQPAEFSPKRIATIKVGDGDGISLTNLPVDADVVFHELGHHVVFRSVKSRKAESVIIHEALADYFLFAKTGNACVAESICLDNTAKCWEPNCLRNGDNTLRIDDPDLPSDLHQISQVFSGMLWDLRGVLGGTLLDPLVFRAIDYLLWESRYEDLVFALMAADEKLNEGENACTIYESAVSRGLGYRIEDIDCRQFVAYRN